jgi:hypothetical protein
MKRYLIKKADGKEMIGVKSDLFTKGDTENYPTFQLEDGTLYTCSISRVTELPEEQDAEVEDPSPAVS